MTYDIMHYLNYCNSICYNKRKHFANDMKMT